MTVIEILERASEPLISYEIIPPKRGGSVSDVMDVVDDLMRFDPPFIDVTSHSAEAYYEELPDGTIRRHVKRKRPGTIGLCAAIKAQFGVEAVPHLLCNGFTREETEDALIELNYLGINNILAIRGDDNGYRKKIGPSKSRNKYALELIEQIAAMNRGEYLEDLLDATPTDFCMGVAGYPEKHFEAPNMTWDILHLKRKVEAGAHYVTTQMFFDNDYFFDFVDRCREVGIDVPIIPGLKILTSKRHLQTLPSYFYTEIPEELAAEVEAADPEDVEDIGVKWAIKQSVELMEAGVPSIHFYIMQNARVVSRVVEELRAMA